MHHTGLAMTEPYCPKFFNGIWAKGVALALYVKGQVLLCQDIVHYLWLYAVFFCVDMNPVVPLALNF